MTITTLQDSKRERLIALGYSGAVPNMERQFYLDRSGTGEGMNNLQMTWLAALGFATGSLQDRLYAYLKSLGYSGTLNEMLQAFWINFSEGGSFRLLTEAGDNLLLENGTDFLRT